MKRLPIILLS
uniref:Uncharacterized protein n=1 Tax=Arundo donax TaxID=35708 RepID=A0A0A9EFT4_ARUDO